MRMATFDTHAEVEFLIGAGLEKKAAEAVVQTVQKGRETDLGKLASKEQLAMLASKEQVTLLEKDVENIMQHSATKADLLEVEKRLDEKISQVKTDMLKWYMATTLIIIGVLISGMSILFNFLKQ